MNENKPRLEKDDPCLAFVKYMIKSEQQRGSDGVGLAKLANDFSKPVLAQAFSRGLVELGQRRHTWTGPTPRTVVDERDDNGKPTATHYEDKQKLHVDKAMQFVLLKRHGSKPITTIIEDDVQLPDPLKYHVRLTNDGLAAAA